MQVAFIEGESTFDPDICKKKLLSTKQTTPRIVDFIVKGVRQQQTEDSEISPVLDVVKKYRDALNPIYHDFAKSGTFKKELFALSEKILALPYIFKRYNRQKRRFFFYAKNIGELELVQFYLPAWAFFNTEGFEYWSDTTDDPIKSGRFKVHVSVGDELKEVKSHWRFEENVCHIITKWFTATFKYFPKKDKGTITIVGPFKEELAVSELRLKRIYRRAGTDDLEDKTKSPQSYANRLTKPLNARVSTDLIDKFVEEAKKRGITQSQFLTEIIEKALN